MDTVVTREDPALTPRRYSVVTVLYVVLLAILIDLTQVRRGP